MATLNKTLETASGLYRFSHGDDVKARWLIELDGKIQMEILKGRPAPALPGEEEKVRSGPMAFPEDGETEMLVQPPYDGMYQYYLVAMDQFYSLDPNYTASYLMFTESYKDFSYHYHREHPPLQKGGLRF